MKQGIKKAVVGILAVSMVAYVGAVSAFSSGTGRNFSDADNDGICDNYAVGQATGQETGQETASSLNRGQNYVDEDNDGVCDNLGTGQGRQYRGGRNQ